VNLLVSECGQPQPIQHSKSNLISLFLMGEMVCFACWRAMGPQAYAEWTNCERIEQFENEAWSAELNEWLLSFGFLGWSARGAGYGLLRQPMLRKERRQAPRKKPKGRNHSWRKKSNHTKQTQLNSPSFLAVRGKPKKEWMNWWSECGESAARPEANHSSISSSLLISFHSHSMKTKKRFHSKDVLKLADIITVLL